MLQKCLEFSTNEGTTLPLNLTTLQTSINPPNIAIYYTNFYCFIAQYFPKPVPTE